MAELPPGPLRAQARHVLASATVGSSSLGLSAYVGEVDLALADAEGDDELLLLHLALADALSIMLRLDESRRHVQAAIELAGRAGAEQPGVAALAEAGFEDSVLGHGVSDNAVRAFERWDEAPLWADTLYSPRMDLACARLHAGELAEAMRLFGEEIHWAERHGLEATEAAARGHLAEAQLRSGEVSLALAGARTAMEHTRQSANPQGIAGQSFNLAFVEAVLGYHEAARALSSTALGEAESSGDVWYTLSHRAVLGLVALAEDDAEGAITALEPAWVLIRDRGVGNLSIFPVAHVLAEAYVGAGRVDDAAEWSGRCGSRRPAGARGRWRWPGAATP